MSQEITCKSFLVPQGTEIRVLSKYVDESGFCATTVVLERDMIIQTDGNPYAVKDVIVTQRGWLGFFIAMSIAGVLSHLFF